MGINVQAFIPKEDPELPDFYKIKVWFHGDKEPTLLEVASHLIVDKAWISTIGTDEKPVHKLAGVNPTPYLEYKTKDDIYGILPLSSFKRLEFDENYSKIQALQEKKRNEPSKQ